MKIVCVIPAFNEAANISLVVSQVKPLVNQVIVVDDGSKDNSADLASQAGATVVRHIINRGQGAALETGNQLALISRADIIVHFDADNQFLPEEIREVSAPIINNQADIVFGSRFMGKKSNMPKLKRLIIIPLGHLLNRLIGIKTSDPQSGFRALNQRAAEMIKIENDGMAHCSEILHKAFNYKLRIKEVPITVIYHQFGNNFSGGLRIIKDLMIKKVLK